MDEMGFESCEADPDVCFSSVMKDDGTDYYQYVLLYTDDILAIMQKPEDFIRHELGKIFVVKPNYIGPPTQYLGNKVSYVNLENCSKCMDLQLVPVYSRRCEKRH